MDLGIGLDLGNLGTSPTAGQLKTMTRQYEFARKYDRTKYQDLVSSSQDAGLHPLFAMGGGAGGGSGPQYVGENTAGQPGLSASSGHKTISPEEAASIRESNARGGLYKKQAEHIQFQMDESIAARIRQLNNSEPGPATQTPANPTIAGNVKIKTGASMGAQAAEDRYHELGGFAQGLINIGADALENLVPAETVERWIKRVQQFKTQSRSRKTDKKYRPGYSFSPYKSQRSNWK